MTTPSRRDLQAEQDHAEFTGWAEAQSYDESFDFNLEDMRDAFTAGMQAARDLADAAEPKPAPDLAESRGYRLVAHEMLRSFEQTSDGRWHAKVGNRVFEGWLKQANGGAS